MSDAYTKLEPAIAEFGETTVRPNILQWERDHLSPKSFFKKAAEFGLLKLETPRELGGLGLNFSDKVKIARQLSHYSMAVTFALINSQNIATRMAVSTTLRHRHDLLPGLLTGELVGCTALTEPHAGSDFAAIKTAATKVSGGWRINGKKAWITNAVNADVIMLYAQTDVEKGWKGIASFLVDARNPGFSRDAKYDLIGGHATGVGGFALNDYFAPDDDLIAPPGDAFKSAMISINGARTYVAAMCTGMLDDALQKATSYGKTRDSFNKSLLDHQGLKWSLTDVKSKIEILDLLTQKAATQIDTNEDAILSAAIAKKYAGEETLSGLETCIQAMGANGIREENLLGHHLACAKIAAYTDGSTEMMKERIAAYL